MTGSSQVKPNEKGAVTVKLNTAGRKGTVIETVEVTFSDPQQPPVTLTIRAYVTDFDMPFPLK